MSYVRSVAVCLALCGLTASAALAQAPVMNPPVVVRRQRHLQLERHRWRHQL